MVVRLSCSLFQLVPVVYSGESVDVLERCVACEEWCVVCFGDGGDECVEVCHGISVVFEALFVFGEDLCGFCRCLEDVVVGEPGDEFGFWVWE